MPNDNSRSNLLRCDARMDAIAPATVSKRRDRPYRSGRSPDWLKIKNRKHPAMARAKDSSGEQAENHLRRNARDGRARVAGLWQRLSLQPLGRDQRLSMAR